MSVALGFLALLAVHFLLRGTYWDYSEGVYALSARMILHGSSLYRGLVGAQPPGVFLVGASLLAVHDSLEWLRFGVALAQLGAGVCAAEIVWRLCGSRVGAALAAPMVMLTPWAVHEHGALTPELVALPLLLGGVLLAQSPRRARALGVVCGLLPLVKVPFVLAAGALILTSAAPVEAATVALLTVAACLGATTLLAGDAFWRDVVIAQTQSGHRSVGALLGMWAQEGWNLAGLVVAAALGFWQRQRIADRRLLITSVALLGALGLTLTSNVKLGTGFNIVVPVEVAVVPLAVCGTVLVVRSRRRVAASLCAVALLFSFAQSLSLFISPHHPRPFLRLGSRPAAQIVMTRPELLAAVAAARSCPKGVAYGGPPLIALLAGRSMPDAQPDQFIVPHARVLHAVAQAVAMVAPVCVPRGLDGA